MKDGLHIDEIAAASDPKALSDLILASVREFEGLIDDSVYRNVRSAAKKVTEQPHDKDALNHYIDKFEEALVIHSVETGRFVESTVHHVHKKSVHRVRNDLIREYRAEATSERMVIDAAVNAYFRYLHASRIYSCFMSKDDSTTYDQVKINMMRELGKQSDIAYRQFQMALTMLRQMKQPPINVKITSEQAFVGQNMQFNQHA